MSHDQKRKESLSGFKSMMLQSVCVYCGSATGNNPVFAQEATHFGRLIAQAGLRLIYGGGNAGLMGTVARAVLHHGGNVTGIIPHFLQEREGQPVEGQETILVDDMHIRKRLMFEQADAFVALPGGIGTLEELVEQLTWAQLGQHKKPVLILNTAQFWEPLITLFDHMREAGFIRPHNDIHYLVTEHTQEIIPMLQRAYEGIRTSHSQLEHSELERIKQL
jgi:uncharacterized protein (TIGR00730 family)